ncbi:MAG: phosphodiesterase [Syntrophothermus sp.]
MRPFLIQISDLHIGAEWTAGDPGEAVERAIAAVEGFPNRPDAVLVSGDLTENGGEEEYARARALLAGLAVPLHVIPGNHDERGAMRRAFGLPGTADEPIQYAVELGPVRLLGLDSLRPGADRGELDEERLAWLERELALEPARPALIAVHHPPLKIGIDVWDEIGLDDASRAGLERVVAASPQVLGVVSGHVHRTLVGQLGGRPALAIPSVYEQARLDFDLRRIELCADPPAFVVHSLIDGRLVSHVQPF